MDKLFLFQAQKNLWFECLFLDSKNFKQKYSEKDNANIEGKTVTRIQCDRNQRCSDHKNFRKAG